MVKKMKLEKRITERELLEGELAQFEKSIQAAFLLFIQNVQSDAVLREVNTLLAGGDLEAALAIVDKHIIRLSGSLTTVFISAGAAEATRLTEKLGALAIGLSFNPTDSDAVELMRANRLRFISNATQAQRDATRLALTQQFEIGAGIRETARAFKDSLGLTPRQVLAVQRYRQLLEQGSLEALNRNLRDRRFDRTIQRAAREDVPLTAEQVNRMVDRYRQRFIKFRAETVARTESVRVTSMARDNALRQVLEQGNISDTRVERVWLPVNDQRTRDHHASMRNQTVGLNQEFVDGQGSRLRFPGDPNAPVNTTANCRCVLQINFKESP